jgi:hypothetical protein
MRMVNSQSDMLIKFQEGFRSTNQISYLQSNWIRLPMITKHLKSNKMQTQGWNV